MADSQAPLPTLVKFATAGLGGIAAWVCIHPVNTLAVRMNLAALSNPTAPRLSFPAFASKIVRADGFFSLYAGLSAGITRQAFYATSRFGLFEVLRDEMAKLRPTDVWSRLVSGCVSGGLAALISCPAEVTLVRLSNDGSLPVAERRNYKGVADAAARIVREEGPMAFYRGCYPFVTRAMLVGACQVGTYDQFKVSYRRVGVTHPTGNVFCAAMSSGLLYSIVTMPFESAKNRMAFQRAGADGRLPYTSTLGTIATVAKKEGFLALYNGFGPYYLRCGGHTVLMFIFVENIRALYRG